MKKDSNSSAVTHTTRWGQTAPTPALFGSSGQFSVPGADAKKKRPHQHLGLVGYSFGCCYLASSGAYQLGLKVQDYTALHFSMTKPVENLVDLV